MPIHVRTSGGLWQPSVQRRGRVCAKNKSLGSTEGHGPASSRTPCPLLSGLLSATWPRLPSSRAAGSSPTGAPFPLHLGQWPQDSAETSR